MTVSAETSPCPLCGSPAQRIGPVLHRQPPQVAGVDIDLGDTAFWVERCSACTFQYKMPAIPEAKLLDCYRKADSTQWGEKIDARERRFDILKALMVKHGLGRRVLDVGCFTGGLLNYLGPEWGKNGLEPGEKASAYAAGLGIKILGKTLQDLAPEDRFDVITAIDVIEHLTDPRGFFEKVSAHLKAKGIFVVLTGDTDSLPWRLYGSRYWYVSLPEHIAFWNRRSTRELGVRTGLTLVDFRRTCHIRPALVRRTKDFLKNVYYLAGHALDDYGIRLSRYAECGAAPMWYTSKDHFFAVLRKVP